MSDVKSLKLASLAVLCQSSPMATWILRAAKLAAQPIPVICPLCGGAHHQEYCPAVGIVNGSGDLFEKLGLVVEHDARCLRANRARGGAE